jgi:HPt (histidine-containing phosphotransfer) domain-containing protein
MELKIINLDYLNEIAAGDHEMIREMISIFNTEVPGYLLRMHQLAEQERWEDLGKLAHKAKASASIMGMADLAIELKQLEQLTLVNKKDTENYTACIRSIERKFNSGIEELKLVSKTL